MAKKFTGQDPTKPGNLAQKKKRKGKRQFKTTGS